ncbi:MAG: type II toxin-antitoxin system HicB family antitoxin [Acutalibacteraceae bacterium]|nr:type II toxin-antitoxin system HicB family antitoxin [Acutalibacteraceae bacterium]
MSKHFYPAIFTKEDTGYSVRFPDLEGCFTEGDTLEEAYNMAVEAVGLYLEGDTVGAFNFPKTQDLSNISTLVNETVVLIEFDEVEYMKRHSNKAVKKTLSIPQWLNTLAEENNINFSQVLQMALKERLNIV